MSAKYYAKDGRVVPAEITLSRCSVTGKERRVLRLGEPLPANAPVTAPELQVTPVTGSLTFSPVDGGAIPRNYSRVWTCAWSGRVSELVLVDPVAGTGSGYWEVESLPTPLPGFRWFRTWAGSTLSEFVLLEVEDDGEIAERHLVPVREYPDGKHPRVRMLEEVESLLRLGFREETLVRLRYLANGGDDRDGEPSWSEALKKAYGENRRDMVYYHDPVPPVPPTEE